MKKGFTIIEMLIVLAVITLITLVTIPNVKKYTEIINEKGCDAQVEVINGAIAAYELKYAETPTESDLIAEGLITKQQLICKNGKVIVIEDGKAICK